MGIGSMDMMFSIFPLLFGIMFIIVIGVFIVVIVKGISQWHQNNQSPVLTVEAELIAKRGDVSCHTHTDGDTTAIRHTTSSTTYYATFQVASGDRMEFCVSGSEYGMLAEGDRGSLTFQGTRYLGFERSR